MLFVIEVFGEPDSLGNARIIERRTHTGPTVSEALRTARANLRMPPPSAYSFSMRLNGKEVARWRRADKADVLDDIESDELGAMKSCGSLRFSARRSAARRSTERRSQKSKGDRTNVGCNYKLS
jgi:hypothetical protein